jgi:hypothetical protein
MPTYLECFPPPKTKAESREATPAPSASSASPMPPCASPSTSAAASKTPANLVSPASPSAASGLNDSLPPPYTQASHDPATPHARRAPKPTPLVLSTPSASRRLASQPVTPSPLGLHAPTSLFIDDEKDDDDDFGQPNPHLLGPAGATPPSSPTADPSTPRYPVNPVWRDAYGVGSSSPAYALKQLPDLSGIMSQRLSSPSPLPPPAEASHAPSASSRAVDASSVSPPPMVEASAKNSTVTVRLHDTGLAHVSGDDVSIAQDGASATASGPGSRAVAVMPGARVAMLAFLEQGVAHAKLARHEHRKGESSSSKQIVEHPPSSPPATPDPPRRAITARRTGGSSTAVAAAASALPSTARIAACLDPVTADEVTAAGITKSRMLSTPLKATYKSVISALPDYGRSFLNVMRIATDIELAATTTEGTISSAGRPAAIGQFKKNKYKFGGNVFKTIETNYPKLLWAWWSRLVVTQRPTVSVPRGASSVQRPSPLRSGMDWSRLRLSSNCGLFDVIVGLLLWRMHIGLQVGSPPSTDDLHAWAELVLDVEGVFRQMESADATSVSDTDDAPPVTTGKRKPRSGVSSRKKVRRGSR